MGMTKRPDCEVTPFALYYREYRAKKAAGTYVADTRYTPELTKDYLEKELGLSVTDSYQIMQTNPRTGKSHICPQRYSNTNMKYIVVTVTDYPEYKDNKKRSSKTIPLHRIIYVMNKGTIPAGFTVDHIDNNVYNNSPDNLQLTTRSENTKKRWKK